MTVREKSYEGEPVWRSAPVRASDCSCFWNRSTTITNRCASHRRPGDAVLMSADDYDSGRKTISVRAGECAPPHGGRCPDKASETAPQRHAKWIEEREMAGRVRGISFDPAAWGRLSVLAVFRSEDGLSDHQIGSRFSAILLPDGKPEPLKGELSGYWSRRIDDEHRPSTERMATKSRLPKARYHY